jgi:outer membrane receptor protein involved in Fe transport
MNNAMLIMEEHSFGMQRRKFLCVYWLRIFFPVFMKKLLITILLCSAVSTVLAQHLDGNLTLKGVIADSLDQKGLVSTTITLKDSANLNVVKRTISKHNGSFEFDGLSKQTYQLTIASVGYRPRIINVPATLWRYIQVAELGKVFLSATTNELKTVLVTTSKPVIRQEIDRLAYDVQADPESKALTVIEMLRKVPMVTVDGDDNIQLQGSSSYRIFINGKPSALMTNNPKDVLRSMPANTVQKIEIITTPPAKYDSEGLAGIINIITTKKTTDGYNGALMARYSAPWGPAGNFTGTFKKDKFGLTGYIGESRQVQTTTGSVNYRETFFPQSTYLQTGDRNNSGNYRYGSAELSFEQDTLHLLTAGFNYNKGAYQSTSDFLSLFSSESPSVLPQSYNLLNNGSNGYTGIDASLNYQLGFKQNKAQLVTASYRYSYFTNTQEDELRIINRLNYDGPDYNQQNDAGSKEHTFQIDYVQPVRKLTIEAGLKAILRNNYSLSAAQNRVVLNGQDILTEDAGRYDNFNYHQNIYSAYNSYSYQLTDWTLKAGIRLEQTHVSANFVTNSSVLDQIYTNLVPSVSIQRRLKNNQSLTFGFTNRLQRPGIWQLNPFVDRSNPQILSTGNPDLQPVTSNLLELNYSRSKTHTLNIKASYFYTGCAVQSVTRLLADTLSLNTFANVGTNRIVRLDFNDNVPIGKKLNVSLNTNIFYVWISGFDNGKFYKNKGPRTNSFASINYKPGKDWSLTVSGGYNRRYINLQGSSKDYAYSNLSVAKSWLSKALTMTGTISNPYQARYAFTQYTRTNDFYQSNTSNSYYRTVSVSLNYKFGKLTSDIKKNQRTINNDDKNSTN